MTINRKKTQKDEKLEEDILLKVAQLTFIGYTNSSCDVYGSNQSSLSPKHYSYQCASKLLLYVLLEVKSSNNLYVIHHSLFRLSLKLYPLVEFAAALVREEHIKGGDKFKRARQIQDTLFEFEDCMLKGETILGATQEKLKSIDIDLFSSKLRPKLEELRKCHDSMLRAYYKLSVGLKISMESEFGTIALDDEKQRLNRTDIILSIIVPIVFMEVDSTFNERKVQEYVNNYIKDTDDFHNEAIGGWSRTRRMNGTYYLNNLRSMKSQQIKNWKKPKESGAFDLLSSLISRHLTEHYPDIFMMLMKINS